MIARLLFIFFFILPVNLRPESEELFREHVHPRLFFSAEEIPDLRQKLKADPLQRLPESLRKELADADVEFSGTEVDLYDRRPMDLATLYWMTGDPAYAEKSAWLIDGFLKDDHFWNDPQSKGLTRSAGAVAAAVAYDLCHGVWPDEQNQRVSRALLHIAQEMYASMGRGANTRTATGPK